MNFLLGLFLAVGTAALAFWNLLMLKAGREHEVEAAEYMLREKKAKFQELEEIYNQDTEALENLKGLSHTWRKLLHNPKSSEKKAVKLQKSIDKLESGDLSGINFLVLPGFALIKMFNVTGDQRFFINMVTLFSVLKGREFAIHNTRYLLSSMGSLAIGGVGIAIVLGVLLVFAGGDSQVGLLITFGGPVMALLLAFVLGEDVKSKSKKRKEEISVDFAQAVTELALLTSSGKEVFPAWGEVCQSPERNGPLYREMRQTVAEIHNGLNPALALEGFIKRCGTKETSRLGASILQNLTRGNDELSRYLTDLSLEVWDERKHNARKLGEQAKSKLILPMMLIFIGIILLVLAPAMLGMADMGF
jgi:tight adherence protein C